MTDELHEDDVLERSLAAWDAPEPPHGLTDRILAYNAETLVSMSAPPRHRAQEESEPIPMHPMHPIEPRTTSSARPFITATLIGFAAAAVLLLAFTAGRRSNSSPAVTPVLPAIELQVTAPAPAVPPAPPPVPAPPLASEPASPVAPDAVPSAPTLRNPFDEAQRKPKPGRTHVIHVEETAQEAKETSDILKNPFRDEPEVPGVLRVGTLPGVQPARVFVDGVEVGFTPIARHEVTPGRHEVKFVWHDQTSIKKVEVGAGKTQVVRGG